MRNMLVTNALITDGRAINGVPHLKMRGCWGQAIAWLFLYGERLSLPEIVNRGLPLAVVCYRGLAGYWSAFYGPIRPRY